MTHPPAAIGAWDAFTTGRPAALGEPRVARGVAAAAAQLLGAAAVRVLPSTLHAFTDLAAALRLERPSLGVDAGAYPLGHLALGGLLAAFGAPRTRLPHHGVSSADA